MIRLMALAFAASIVWVQTLAALPTGIALLLPAGGLLLGWRVGRPADGAGRMALALLAALLIGAGWAGWRAELRLAEALPAAWEGRDLLVAGVVDELPRQYGDGSRFVFAVEAVLNESAQVPSRLLLSWYPPSPKDPDVAAATATEQTTTFVPRPGDRWQLTVRLKRPHGQANPGGFDYEAWLLERDLRATGYVRTAPAPRALAADRPSVRQSIEALRHALRERMQATTGGLQHGGVLVGLALGDQGSITAADWRLFAATGVSHLMSVSGLHVTMFAGLAGVLAGACWRRVPRLALRLASQRVAVLAGALAALAYVALSGFGVPAQRTLVMLGLAALALWRGGEMSPSRVLAGALVVVLAIDPWAVLAPGFWLSFVAVAALLMVAAPTAARLPQNTKRPALRRTLANFGLTQWAATLATAPLLLLFFQALSLVSPLANLVAIPVVSLLVTPVAVAAALSGLDGLLVPAHAVTALLIDGLQLLANLPGALRGQPAPPFWALLLATAGILWLLLPRGVGGRFAAACLLLPALFPGAERPADGEARARVFDVGHGLAVLVETRTHALLFDTGPPYGRGDFAADAGERVIVPALRTLGIERLDRLILSHGDSDHTGGAASVRAALPVGAIHAHLPADRPLPDAPPLAGCTSGESWRWDGVTLTFLNRPARGRGDNHDSCVLRVESAAGRRLLLTADLEARDEAALLADGVDLRADVLQVPHQGSKGASSPAFLRAVAPTDAIAGVGYRNRFGHPHAETLARYAAIGTPVWRTDRDGMLDVRLADTARVTAWRAVRPRYWQGR